MMRAQRTKRRQEPIQISITVTYDTPFNSGASRVRLRMFITRLDRLMSSAMDSLAVGKLAGTKNEDHDRATITILGKAMTIM